MSTQNTAAFVAALEEAAAASEAQLAPAVLEAFAAHYSLLVRWNQTHNLTRVVEPKEAARLHYLDCWLPLSGLPEPTAFVDVGSGAGFPGLMAALRWPGARAILVEPAAKRASFLTLAAGAMGVAVEVVEPGAAPTARGPAPLVLSRATFSPGKRSALCAWAQPAGTVAVWGHLHDRATWKSEVTTWPARDAGVVTYQVAGLEPRVLLLATMTDR